MTTVILFVLGAIIGSFLNVVALRWNSGLSLGGRSACQTCSKKLNWYELLPILSFFILRGRCLSCKTKISFQYPIIELWTALVFVTVPLSFIPVFCFYIAITIYDLRHKIIPDGLVYPAILLSLIEFHLWAGATVFFFFAAVWLLSRGRAMGFGDAKLGLSVGLLLGFAVGFSAVILAFWIGAAYGISAMIFSRKNITIKSEVPFAPFIIVGAWLAVVFQLDLLHVSLF